MEADQHELGAGAALPGLHGSLPHARKSGHGIGGTGGRMLLGAIIDAGGDGDAFFNNSMASIRKAGELRGTMPAGTRDECEAVPTVADPDDWGPVAPWNHVGRDRQAGGGAAAGRAARRQAAAGGRAKRLRGPAGRGGSVPPPRGRGAVPRMRTRR